MLVKDRMSSPVTTVAPDLPITEAIELLKQHQIRRLPVIHKNKLVGIVTESDLHDARPSKATSLSIWEINYLVSRIKVQEVMSKNVLTVDADTPIEEAATLMADHAVGGLPVMSKSKLVGLITETDIFKAFIDLLGARKPGLRLSVVARDEPGGLARLSQAILTAGGNIISVGAFSGTAPRTYHLVIRLEGVEQKKLEEVIQPFVLEILDIRKV